MPHSGRPVWWPRGVRVHEENPRQAEEPDAEDLRHVCPTFGFSAPSELFVSEALGATRNPEWAKETLEFALSHGRDQVSAEVLCEGSVWALTARAGSAVVHRCCALERRHAPCSNRVLQGELRHCTHILALSVNRRSSPCLQLMKRTDGNFSITIIVRVSSFVRPCLGAG
jgi:hypothetical protein